MLKKVLKEKNRKEVKKMILTGEIHQYYATTDEIVNAVAARLWCPKFVALKMIKRADECRTQAFKQTLASFDLPATIARW